MNTTHLLSALIWLPALAGVFALFLPHAAAEPPPRPAVTGPA